MSKCSTCLKCQYLTAEDYWCSEGLWANDPKIFNSSGPKNTDWDDCEKYEPDYSCIAPFTLIAQYWRTKDGRIIPGDIVEQSGLLPDINVVQAIVEKCNQSIQDVPQKQRDLEQELFWDSFDKPKKQPFTKPKKPTRAGTVYVMRDTVRGFYKIGFTTNISNRFAALKTANPAIEITTHYPGSISDERKLHKMFTVLDKHVDREWFELDDSDLDLIKEFFTLEPETTC